METLVIGYGKIGRVKSFIWQSLGRTVYVYDNDPRKVALAHIDGFLTVASGIQFSNDLIVDISTPASFHTQSLEWFIATFNCMPRAILIEKPLISDNSELDNLERLLTGEQCKNLQHRIQVNESYYLSSALEYVIEDIKSHGHQLKSVRAEMSKNRLEDIGYGRFVDGHLGPYGIELPHMLALVQGLGISLDAMTIESNILHTGRKLHDDGLTIRAKAGDVLITLASYLGSFRVYNHTALRNSAPLRVLNIETSGTKYKVEFDPAPGIERYMSRITMQPAIGKPETIVMNDNHLLRNLQLLHKPEVGNEFSRLLSLGNGVDVSSFILALHEKAKCLPTQSVKRISKSSVNTFGELRA